LDGAEIKYQLNGFIRHQVNKQWIVEYSYLQLFENAFVQVALSLLASVGLIFSIHIITLKLHKPLTVKVL